MKKFLLVFAHDILTLGSYSDNIIIAGSNVLRAHGLLFDWEPHDLDIVIFRPTEWQLGWLEENAKSCNSYGDSEEDLVWEVKKQDDLFKLNIILEYDANLPEDLLWLHIGEAFKMRVASIEAIVQAKAKYAMAHSREHIALKSVQQLQKLKNLNFNV